jgi:hemin uptake protein HemP
MSDACPKVQAGEPPRTSARPEAQGLIQEPVISARELLAGGHRVWIEHATQRYLLQVTRNGKLILTK